MTTSALTGIVLATMILIPLVEAGPSGRSGGQSQPTPQPAPGAPDDAAVQRGLSIYGFYCMSCHGGDGKGGLEGGSDLTESAMLKADDAAAQFAALIPVGRPEQRMPPTPLPENEIADLWAFVKVLAAARGSAETGAGTAATAGDSKKGEQIFTRSGCGRCHSITGDLARIGTRLDVAAIRQRVVKPPASTARNGTESTRAAAGTRQEHDESVKKLNDQAVRDVAAYLSTLR